MILGIDLIKYKTVKIMTAGNEVLFLWVKKVTGMSRKILWLIGSKNLKGEWQKERKRVENGKFLLVEKIQILCQLTLSHQQKRKRNSNVGDIINRHRHLPQLPAIPVPIRNRIMADLNLSLKIKNLNENYPKVWPTTQTNILQSKLKRIVWERPYCAKNSSQIILIMLRS